MDPQGRMRSVCHESPWISLPSAWASFPRQVYYQKCTIRTGNCASNFLNFTVALVSSHAPCPRGSLIVCQRTIDSVLSRWKYTRSMIRIYKFSPMLPTTPIPHPASHGADLFTALLFTSSVLESPLISTVTSVTVTTYDQSGGISRP
jgi:hypothetical protein